MHCLRRLKCLKRIPVILLNNNGIPTLVPIGIHGNNLPFCDVSNHERNIFR